MTKHEYIVYAAIMVVAIGVLIAGAVVGSMIVVSGFISPIPMFILPIAPLAVGGIYLLISEK